MRVFRNARARSSRHAIARPGMARAARRAGATRRTTTYKAAKRAAGKHIQKHGKKYAKKYSQKGKAYAKRKGKEGKAYVKHKGRQALKKGMKKLGSFAKHEGGKVAKDVEDIAAASVAAMTAAAIFKYLPALALA